MYRYVQSLTLLRKIFVPTVLVIFLAAALPPYFLWFLGELVSCVDDAACTVQHNILGWGLVFPLTVSTLLTLTVFAMLLRIGAWMLFELSGQWSTQSIHADMMKSVFDVRTTFFDENPSGRLINRLLGDYGVLRIGGVVSLGDTTNGLAEVLCIGLLIMLANPIAGLLIIPVVMLYVALQLQLAPMLSHSREIRAVKIGEALHRETDLIEGRTIFRLYNKQKNLLDRIHKPYGDSLNIQLFLNAWGMLWMGMISAGYAVIVYAFLIYGLHAGLISTVLAAVIITAVFNLNSVFFGLAWDMSFLGETASHARRAFYMIDLPKETEEESRIGRTGGPAESELSGDIVFEHYSMSYRHDSPLILDDLSLRILEGKKVGIVGRTGAGKSSLMQALFRMVYHYDGDIRVGSQSIFDVDIHSVRRQFGVGPQDPYLFSGSIRFNLAGELSDVSDDRLREVLRVVGLDVDLDANVLEGGRDYSVGERQLLCIARLILLDKQYILMDEPTSSLDRKSDEKMQRLMNTVLADKTVITIAHRLESLERYDLILEMADGHLLRQGAPVEMMSVLRKQSVA
ncbi:MAG TPA: hypothetical protein DCM54_17090 [Gammaproteobacteria bacterium]|nr:hypothetical protein [Gammaproteobacteria bacterium]